MKSAVTMMNSAVTMMECVLKMLNVSVLWLPATIGEQRTSRALASLARQRLLPQGFLPTLRRWVKGEVWVDYPQLAAVRCYTKSQ